MVIVRAVKYGDWAKVTGGDAGAFFNGREWIGFDCIGCMYARKILSPKNRLQLADVAPRVYKAIQTNKQYWHDRDLHAAWLKAGKPTI